MKSKKLLLMSAIGLGLLSLQARAEIAYVTDRLLLGLYAEADAESQQYKTLPSGSKVDVQERRGLYARVITDDGLEGWVKYHFLVNDAPAVVRIKSLEAQLENRAAPADNSELKSEVESLQAQNLSLNERLLQMRGELQMAQQALVEQAERAAQAGPAQSDAAGETTETPAEPPLEASEDPQLVALAAVLTDNPPWLPAGLAVLGGLAGFLVGSRWMAGRVRRRFGGLKVW